MDYSFIEALGVLPYIYIYIKQKSYMAIIVFLNGLLYHALFPHNIVIKFYDIIMNSIMIMYVNIKTRNTGFVLSMTLVSIIVYLFNINYDHKIMHPILHVIGVQWCLGIVLQSFNNEDKLNNDQSLSLFV